VKLINTDGLAIVGPGSEWFWTAVSGLILAITFFAIYRQLRLQRDAAIDQVNDLITEWSSERMARAKLAVLVALEAGTDPLDLPNRASTHIAFFWQRIGYLAQRRHMDGGLIYEHLGSQIEDWWFWLRPRVLAEREADHDPGVWQGFEWLAADAAARDADRGVPSFRDDAEMQAKWLPSSIEHFQQAIDLEEALRTVQVRTTVTPISVTIVRPGQEAPMATDMEAAGLPA
jgi:hypothetical protein